MGGLRIAAAEGFAALIAGDWVHSCRGENCSWVLLRVEEGIGVRGRGGAALEVHYSWRFGENGEEEVDVRERVRL